MTSLLAHGGTGGLVVELTLLSLPVLGVALLWWWGRRPSPERPAETEPGPADEPDKEVEP